MRNLKKVLSLALALVMLLGMMVVAAGAEDYTDADAITKNEAVDVMSALGILEGSNGTFNPQGNLRREQAAKILVYVSDGPAVANALTQGTTQFEDVPASHWASGYVAYCANLGIISGKSATKFDPRGELTAEQFAKMLLVAMGSEADYTGDSFSANVKRDAIKAELIENVGSFVWNKAITREQAAQMAFNAMTKDLDGGKMVYPVINGNVSPSVVVATFDTALEAAMYANALGAGYTAGAPVRDTAGTLGEKNYGLKPATTADAFGRPTKTWTANDDVEVVIDGSTAVVTYTSKTKAADVAKDLKGYSFSANSKSITYNTSAAEAAYTASTAVDNTIAGLTGNGKVVEVYASGKTITNVVVLDKRVVKLTADPVVKDDKVTISAAGIVNAETKNVKGYDTVAKGDVVLYVGNGKGAFMIEPAEKITAAVTGYTTGTFNAEIDGCKALIDGERYAKSALTGSGMNYAGKITDTKTYDIWLDNGRNIVATAVASTGETQTAQLAVVQEVAYVQPSTDHAIGSSAKPYIQARLVFMDGTSEVVKVGSVNGYKLINKADKIKTVEVDSTAATHYTQAATDAALTPKMANGQTITAVAEKTFGETGEGPFYAVYKDTDTTIDATNTKLYGKYYAIDKANNAATVASLATLIPAKTFFSYTEKDGVYTLTTPDATEIGTQAALTSAVITGKVPAYQTGKVANANTVFIYATKDSDDKYTFTAYTGIANVPTTKAAVTGNVITKGGVAAYVYADLGTNGVSTATSDKVFITNDDFVTVNGSTAYKQGTVLLNGEETELKLADASYTVGKLYTASVGDDEIYTLTAVDQESQIKSVEGNVLVVRNKDDNGDTVYSYADDAVAYVLELDDTVNTTTISALMLDANDKITVVTDTDGAAVAAYVQKVSQAPATVTLVTATDSTNSVTVPTDGTQAMATSKSATVTGWTADHCKVNLTLDATSSTKIKSLAVNGTEITEGLTGGGATPDLTAAANVALVKGTNTITIVVSDDNGGPDEIFTYTVKAEAAV